MNWHCEAPRRTDRVTRSLALTNQALAVLDADYQPWPRVPVTCLRCHHTLATCRCWDEWMPREAS